MNQQPLEPRPHNVLVIVIFLFLELTFVFTVLAALKLPVTIDFISFYLAGEARSEGLNIYDFEEIKRLASGYQQLTEMAERFSIETPAFPYLYLPVTAFYIMPLTRLDITAASFVWLLLSFALYGSTMAMVIKMAPVMVDLGEGRKRRYMLLLWALFISYVMPFKHSLFFGQVNTFMLTLVVAALFLIFYRRREVLGGALLAAAALGKVIPGILMIIFLIRRSKKVVAGFLGGAIAIAAPTLVTGTGLRSWSEFFSFSPAMAHGSSVPGLFPASEVFTFSIAGFYARLIDNPGAVRALSLLTIVALLALLLSQCGGLRTRSQVGLFLMPCLILMIISSPLTYVHHIVFIYPGVVFCILHLLARGGRSSRIFVPAIMVLLTVASLPLPFLLKMAPAGLPALAKSPNLYALLGLFCLGTWILRQAAHGDEKTLLGETSQAEARHPTAP